MKRFLFVVLALIFLATSLDATTWYFWRYRTHATDCTSLTDGRLGDLCYEEDDGSLYICDTEDGLCDTASEWKCVSSSGGTQNVFLYVSDGTNTAQADSPTDTLTFEAGTGISITVDETNDKVTIASTGGGGEGDITAVGDATSGDAFTADGSGNVLYFEGATADAYETILQGQDVTSDVTINLPASTGTLVTKEQIDTETEFESLLFSVFTPNDGSLSDDDLSNNTTDDLPEGTTNKYCTLTNIQSVCSNDFHNIGGTDDDVPDSDAEVPDDITVSGGTISNSDITLKSGTSPTAEGRIEWDSTNDRIVVGDGTGTKVFYSGDPILETELDTEAELESKLTDVTNVYTNNDGSLTDDDLSDNSIGDLSDVDKSGWAEGKLLKFNASGNLVVGTDNVNDADADATNELQNIFQNITDGTNTATADSTTDTFTLEAGTGISITVDATNDKATITNTGDTDASDDLTTSTSFSGDVSGTYNNLQLGSGVVTTTEIADGTIDDGDISSSADTRIAAIEVIIDGGGNAITTGVKADIEVPFNCTILQATALADQTGSIQVDIWKDTYANFPPTDADSITGSNPVSISSSNKSQDSTLSGWTTTINAGDILRFNVDSCSTITRCTISLKVRKD